MKSEFSLHDASCWGKHVDELDLLIIFDLSESSPTSQPSLTLSMIFSLNSIAALPSFTILGSFGTSRRSSSRLLE